MTVTIFTMVVKEVPTAVKEKSSSGVKPCSAWGIVLTLDRLNSTMSKIPVSTVNKIL